jgi:hypothetical protein
MELQQPGRLAYWQGQELRSRDLRDQSRSLEQLRWWHNRASHHVFGVSQRLSISVDSDSPGMVKVDCGLAYDCFGRELVLSTSRVIPFPVVNGAQYLVLAYANNTAGLKWIARNEFRASSGVPLALFWVHAGAYLKDDTFRPPAARALSRPRIGAGFTIPGNTPWEKLPDDAGLKVFVNTSSAGFTRAPFYLASLNWLEENTEFTTPIVSVTDGSEKGFTLRSLLSTFTEELLPVVTGVALVDNTPDLTRRTFRLGQKIPLGVGADLQTKDVVARLLPRAQLAVPIKTVKRQAIELEADFPAGPLKKDEAVVLGRLPAMANITAPGISAEPGMNGLNFASITVDKIQGFHEGDLVGIGTSPVYEPAIVDKEPQGNTVKIRSAGIFAGNGVGMAVVVADFPIRSTVQTAAQPPPPLGAIPELAVTVGDFTGFHQNDVVASLAGTQVLESAILLPSPTPGVLRLSTSSMQNLKRGDVLGVARFSRASKVGTVDPAGIAIEMKEPAEVGFFRPGDTVANLSSAPPLTLAVVDKVVVNTLFLQTAIPGLRQDDTLGIVALNAVTLKTDPIPDATHFSVDNPAAARAGGIAARLTGWIDASRAVQIQNAGPPLVVDSLPDGLSTGDAVGFAALSPTQPAIRFQASISAQAQPVNVAGVDEKSGKTVAVSALLTPVDGQFANLTFPGGGDFVLRPEAMRVTAKSRIDDFLAYAQRKGLNVCWLGCQMPAAGEPSCPELVQDTCGCR